METTLGGDRLGSGNKQTLSFRNYERSSHDLGYIWRSSMASGTLVPFMNRVALPGDVWDIDLNCEVLTLPTIGPLFGSYKVQLDVFEIPMRLYNAKLHMNKLGVGMDMSKIFLPQIEVKATNKRTATTQEWDDNEQINSSALLKYLGISGLGRYLSTAPNPLIREFNAIPLLAYWDIYKNYYSNKQEEIGFYIHSSSGSIDEAYTPTAADCYHENGDFIGSINATTDLLLITGDYMRIFFPSNANAPDPNTVMLYETGYGARSVKEVFTATMWEEENKTLQCDYLKAAHNNKAFSLQAVPATPQYPPLNNFALNQFPLENIDTMREKLLQYNGSSAYVIKSTEIEPYNASMQVIGTSFSVEGSQESLAIKTYQSDLFNNWINTEWIDGTGGISELTAVDTTGDSFTIDALNIATKVYDMLNRIAVSGGTYDDWLEAVYTHERVRGVESPVYCGSLIKELAFEEVVSLAESGETGNKSPLGTLAGRGKLTGKHKGGKIKININEPSYIMGIVSITPRIDYSQGNDWDVNLKTYDDFHKPALDGIGFQDLITEQLLWSDTEVTALGITTQKSLGKQPAWINYMTAVNKTYGSFAEQNNSMFMTLNRRYEKNTDGTLKDGTSYIDPVKYNNIFAEVALGSMNFWVQIALDITARRKMSAKIIPNL